MIYTPPSKGTLVLLASLVPAVQQTLPALNVFSSAYDSYLILCEGLSPSGAAPLTLTIANAGVVDAAANYYSIATPGTVSGASAASAAVSGGASIGAGLAYTLAIEVLNANDAANSKLITARGMARTALHTYNFVDSGVAYEGGIASGFQLAWSGANNFAASGLVTVYGVGKQ